MSGQAKKIRLYVTPSEKIPFEEWLSDLKDRRGRVLIRLRIDRLRMGNPGKYRSLGDDLYELKIDYSPGYRVYYGEKGDSVVLLLCGGHKGSQSKDIQKARKYWKAYRSSI